MTKHVIVIGAGASGLMAAIAAARENASVTVLEAGDKPGKKLLMTGNGRCNLTNSDFSRPDCYRGASRFFVKRVLEQFPAETTRSFFEELGLLTQERSGWIYPLTDQASAVLEILLLEAYRLKIKIKCREKAQELFRDEGGWRVRTQSWTYCADRVILSCGSKAAPFTGSDGSGYELAVQLGHRICPVTQALVPLTVLEPWVKKLAGLRIKAALTMGEHREMGELQWTEYGISGIVVFQLSRYAVKETEAGGHPVIFIDCIPSVSQPELIRLLNRKKPGNTAQELLTGVFPKKLIPVLLDLCKIRPQEKLKDLSHEKLVVLSRTAKRLTVTISGARSFDMAQVCAGGVDTSEIRPETLESRLAPGIFMTGELLDVDGICGGYNLQWAWSSGYVAGIHSVL